MKVIAILFIAFAVASGLQMYEKYPKLMNFSAKRSIMAVMTQVEAHLQNNGPLDAITRILDEYENEIHAEQLSHDQLYERQTAECVDEFAFRQEEVDEANAALKEATETLTGCEQQRVRAKEDLTITKKQIKEKTAELINVHTVRRREKYAFDTAMGVYDIVHPAIGEALDFLDALFAGEGSFLQLSRHSNKILLQAVQLRKAHHMAPVLSALAQLASENEDVIADADLLNKLKGLFLTMRAKFEAEHKEQIAIEEAAIQKYNSDVTRIEGILDNLSEQQADLENEIADLDKCIITQQNIIASATQKKDRNQRLLDDAIKMCHAMDVQYEAAKTGRRAELDLLGAIKVKVDEHFAKLTSGVTARGEQDEFDAYENQNVTENKFVPQ